MVACVFEVRVPLASWLRESSRMGVCAMNWQSCERAFGAAHIAWSTVLQPSELCAIVESPHHDATSSIWGELR